MKGATTTGGKHQTTREVKQNDKEHKTTRVSRRPEGTQGDICNGQKSYSQAVKNNHQHGSRNQTNVEQTSVEKRWIPKKITRQEEKVEEWKGMSYTANEEDLKWAKKGFIGRVHNFDEVPLLQQKIMDVGILSIRVIPMGGDKVFINVEEEEDFHSLVKDTEEFFQHWFKEIKEWSPEAMIAERYTWIRLFGVPVHAWNRHFFAKVCITNGSLINLDSATENKRRLDVARCLVRTTAMESINKVIKVKISGRVFAIRMVEELFPCLIEGSEVIRDNNEENDEDESLAYEDVYEDPCLQEVDEVDEVEVQ
ncbi:DUF4283 domain protein, partial [Trifolium medium]|nr:DUF4283 domain protein [Trifolium medium]